VECRRLLEPSTSTQTAAVDSQVSFTLKKQQKMTIHSQGCERLLGPQDSCNHQRAWQLYQASLRNREGFIAVKCKSYDDFLNIDNGGNCDKNDLNFMGLNAMRK
jgi:hypothetical protein